MAKKQPPATKVEMWPLGRIKPYEKNPRKQSDAAVEKVAASIKEFGFNQPVVVDKGGVIVVGHKRYFAALSLGLDAAPVIKADWLTEAQAKAYRIADNRTNDETEWDEGLLAGELAGLTIAEFDLSLTGFDVSEIDRIMEADGAGGEGQADAGLGEIELPPEPKYKEQYGVIVLCRDEQEQAEVYERLVKDGLNCKVVAT
jgi:ParB-like chromosome segregation protein Spo0J